MNRLEPKSCFREEANFSSLSVAAPGDGRTPSESFAAASGFPKDFWPIWTRGLARIHERRANMKTEFAPPPLPATHRVAPPAVHTASGPVEASVIATIVAAFAADPVARWMYPEPGQYLSHFPEFVRAFAGRAFDHNSAHHLAGFEGAALWLPPDVQPDDDAIASILERTVAEAQQPALSSIFEQMASFHPAEPHWYLPMIGVDPARQRRGYGAVLLRHALRECDRAQQAAYLESSNPENIPLYERHGFAAHGRIQAGNSPTLYPMLREPRAV